MKDLISNSPNLIYLGLIVIFLILNFIANNRVGFYVIIKHISIWVIIFLLGILAYSYRYEINNTKERIVRELAPGSATHNRKTGAIILNQATDGHFYLNTIINRKKVRFLIDTGASDIALNLQDAQNIGINIKKIKFNKIYNTANGKTYGASVILDHLIVGRVKFNRVSASIMSSDMDISLLGMTFLNRLKKYEFKNSNLILYY